MRVFFGALIAASFAQYGVFAQQKPITRNVPDHPLVADNIADPSVVRFRDTFYLYATTDVDAGLAKGGTPVVWRSADFVNWSFDGPLQLGNMDWSKPYTFTDVKGAQKTGYFRYWAPGKAVLKDNKYYLFPTIVTPDDKMGTYTVVADHPQGPFRFTNGTGVYFQQPEKEAEQSKPIVPDIDGEPFIDDDGKAYMYWRRRFATALENDLLTAQGETITIPTKLPGYSEGPGVFKRNGRYYYFYTLSGNASYCNGYMVSDKSPLGPFTIPAGKNIFIQSDTATGVWGPGHGNVLHVADKDDYLFLYLEYGEGGTTRQVYANKMLFNADGTIQPVKVHKQGVGSYRKCKYLPEDNKALSATITASSFKKERVVTTRIDADKEGGDSSFQGIKSISRTFTYAPDNAADNSNGTRWWAAAEDKEPWIQFDLGKVQKLKRCELYFVFPAYGHSWILEKSADGKSWTTCGEQPDLKICSPHVISTIGKARYLRVKIKGGTPGLWECKIY
ncbi:beta-xylosidase [Filimonas zeae]|nr:family 43 glycosylhydrolase [Filimonas zeae]MDR6340819.1 beta-xylosidase [Filimonas zeae]